MTQKNAKAVSTETTAMASSEKKIENEANVIQMTNYENLKKFYLSTLSKANSVENAQKLICDFFTKYVIPDRSKNIESAAPAVEKIGYFNLEKTTITFTIESNKKAKFSYGRNSVNIIQKDFIALNQSDFRDTMEYICSPLHLKCSDFRKGAFASYETLFDVSFDFEE